MTRPRSRAEQCGRPRLEPRPSLSRSGSDRLCLGWPVQEPLSRAVERHQCRRGQRLRRRWSLREHRADRSKSWAWPAVTERPRQSSCRGRPRDPVRSSQDFEPSSLPVLRLIKCKRVQAWQGNLAKICIRRRATLIQFALDLHVRHRAGEHDGSHLGLISRPASPDLIYRKPGWVHQAAGSLLSGQRRGSRWISQSSAAPVPPARRPFSPR